MILSYLREHFWQLFRYGAASVLSISFVFVSNYFFIDVLKMDPRLGNFITVSVAYAYMYFLSCNFIFKKKVCVQNMKFFIIYIFVFWTLNNAFFSITYSITHWSYLIITAANILLFFPLRFYSQKYLVFKDF